MADFLRTSNDWDLEAIIRGLGGGGSGGCAVVQLPPPSPAPLLGFEGFEFDGSELVTGGVVVNELEEMYKPFVVQVEQSKNESPRSSQTETTSPCSSSFALFDHEDDVERPKEMEMEMKELVDLDVEGHAQARSSCKKRKSKHKTVRVVHRGVGEDGVLMDKWNWRKYGQKAIKGSPYPRSYYRCSSSGGCHARKHVEQSKDDRHTFIVTYIADHSHLPPTRRHAQAGRKLIKFSSSSAAASTTNVVNTHNKIPPASMMWTISDPSIVEDGDQAVLGGESSSTGVVESTGLEVMEELFSAASYDHDFNNWEFDPIFSTYIC